ncbi:MAG: class I SAM-dependent methyltransferase [Patescibacteria group bacterium]|jgi:ubiquinone/menaquinone biosynthesis C-methylase UbiE
MENSSGGNQLLDPQAVLAVSGVKLGSRVADLGCGAVGHFVFPASQLVGKSGKVYAVDIRATVLDGIKRRAHLAGLENIQVLRANLENNKGTGLPDGSADVAMLINVLFQNDKREEVLREALRVVKPGGTLLVIDWRSEPSVIGPVAERRVRSEGVARFCQAQGAELVKRFEPSKWHFGLLFKKINKPR